MMRLDQFLDSELHDLLSHQKAWITIQPGPGWYELSVRTNFCLVSTPTYTELLCLKVSRADFRTRTELWGDFVEQIRLVLIFQS